MEGKRDAAIRAHFHMAALRTLKRGGIAAAIEEDDRLLVAIDARLDGFDQTRCNEDGRIALFGGANIEDMRHRHLALLDALEQFDQAVLTLLRVVVRFERGRGRAEHDGDALEMAAHHGDIARVVMGRFLLLVGMLVLLVHHDDAQIVERREHRRARADDDPGAAGADVLPLVVALAGGEMAVEYGDADFPADEPGAEMLDGLRGERDFRHEHEGAFAEGQHLGDGLEIDLRLAAAGDAMQKDDARLLGGDFLPNDLEGRLRSASPFQAATLHPDCSLSSASQPGPFFWRKSQAASWTRAFFSAGATSSGSAAASGSTQRRCLKAASARRTALGKTLSRAMVSGAQ